MRQKYRYILIIFVVINIVSFCFGQFTRNIIEIDKKISIESKILKETRDIYIYLPEGYDQSEKSYPVMYVLDGETNFFISSAIASFMSFGRNGQIPQMIVVGIPNIARMRDFTPIPVQERINSGGADNFIEFLDKELIEYINNTYRTNDYRILFGHSLCGMFSMYTLITNPSLFQSHIAASPFLMYGDDYVINKAKEILSNQPNLSNQIYLSKGDEPDYTNSLDKFTSLLTNNSPRINWTLKTYINENHNSVPFRTIADGLAFIFSDMPLTDDIVLKGVEAIKEHVNNCITKYGFAIEIFEYNVELYQNSANVYDSLGDAYDRQGLKKKAINSYKQAVYIGQKSNDANLQAYKSNLDRLINQ